MTLLFPYRGYAQTGDFCGNYVHNTPAALANDSSPIYMYDRFGNRYFPGELAVDPGYYGGSGGGGQPLSSGSAVCATDLFELCFEDVLYGTNCGFDDQTLGQARRDVVCQVFKDLEVLLDYPQMGQLVRIQVQMSGNCYQANQGWPNYGYHYSCHWRSSLAYHQWCHLERLC